MTTIQSASPEAPESLKVWKTIKLGTGLKDVDGFWAARTANDMRMSVLVISILGGKRFTVARRPSEIDLVIIDLSQLGFANKKATFADIYAAANRIGLDQIRRMFRMEGREYQLSLTRGGTALEVRIKTRRLV